MQTNETHLTLSAMRPHGAALLAYLDGDFGASLQIHRDDGFTSIKPVREFFRTGDSFDAIDRAAIDLARGRVLDVGAGSGTHSLTLQEKGLAVVAIDVDQAAVEVMRRRGLRHVECASVFDYDEKGFDTIIMLGHGAGIAGTIQGLDRLLSALGRLLAPQGQLLVDSLDVRGTKNPLHLAYQDANRSSGRYFGEMRLRFQFGTLAGGEVDWLHVDPETFELHARTAGWVFKVVVADDGGNYLARMVRAA